MYSENREAYFEEFFIDINSVLEDLCQSGFHTVHDSTLQELKEKGDTAAQCGMQYLSDLLLSLQEELSQRRHNISDDKNTDTLIAEYYVKLIEYIEHGRKKTAYDKGKNYYLKEEQ